MKSDYRRAFLRGLLGYVSWDTPQPAGGTRPAGKTRILRVPAEGWSLCTLITGGGQLVTFSVRGKPRCALTTYDVWIGRLHVSWELEQGE